MEDWRDKELMPKLRDDAIRRFLDEVWKPLPEDLYTRINELGIVIPHDLYVHEAEQDPALIAYVNIDKSNQWKSLFSTRSRIGKFITAIGYGEHAPEISALYRKLLGQIEFGIAYTEEEIVDVYDQGPSSCMGAKGLDNFRSRVDGELMHPCAVYAGSGDIGVAYLKRKHDGEINARAVVNLRDKEYCRVYGDGVMHDILSEHGFDSTESALNGCRLRFVESDRGLPVAPYIDGYPIWAYVETDKLTNTQWLVLSEGVQQYKLESIDGLASRGQKCDDCGEYCSADDGGTTPDGEFICANCIDDHWVWARNNNWSTELTHEEDAHWSEILQEYCTETYFDETHVYDYNGEWQLAEECVECYFTDEWVRQDEAVQVRLPDGETVDAVRNEERFQHSEYYNCLIDTEQAMETFIYPEGI